MDILTSAKKEIGYRPVKLYSISLNADLTLVHEFEASIISDIITEDLLSSFLNTSKDIAYILFVPLTLSTEKATPNLVINNKVIALKYYQDLGDIPTIIEELESQDFPESNQTLLLAMWKSFYLNLAERIGNELSTGSNKNQYDVHNCFADEYSQEEIITRLSSKDFKKAVLYFGHGRSRGWSGYRGLRWNHFKYNIPHSPSIGSLLSFTCDNLKFEFNRIPFGIQLIRNGLASAFLGTIDSVKIQPMKKICLITASLMSNSTSIETIADLILALNEWITHQKDIEIRECWSKFRLIGNPLSPI